MNNLEAALVVGKGIEPVFSFEAELADFFSLFLALGQGFEIGEEFGVFPLKDFGVDFVEFWMGFFDGKEGVHQFVMGDAGVIVECIKKGIVGETTKV